MPRALVITSCLVRAATIQDAAAAVAVLRDSITQLCVADHQNDTTTLEQWLRNKTTDHFRQWLADPENFLVVAEVDSVVSGVGLVDVRGDLRLCYVSPGRQRLGIGRAMLCALEAQAIRWNIEEVRLRSSANGCAFYERLGYHSTGEAGPAFGVLRDYPYAKTLRSVAV